MFKRVRSFRSAPTPSASVALVGLWIVSLVLASGCEQAAAPAEPAVSPDSSGETVSTRWVHPARPNDPSLLSAPAVVRAVGARADVSALTRVRVLAIHVEPGAEVVAGDPIVDVAAPEVIAAAASYVGAGRSRRLHEERAEELSALVDEGLSSRTEVYAPQAEASALALERDRAAAELRAAGVDPREAGRILRAGRLRLSAPVAGVVVELGARVGEIVEPGAAPLARVVGAAPARVEVRSARAWPPIASLRFVGQDGRELPLSETPLAQVVDPADGTQLAWYSPRDEGPLPDGLLGTALASAAEGLWEVPVRALGQRTGESAVLRRRAGQTARVPVRVWASSGSVAVVAGELEEDDQIASEFIGDNAGALLESGDEARDGSEQP